jgi:hypothetical protein
VSSNSVRAMTIIFDNEVDCTLFRRKCVNAAQLASWKQDQNINKKIRMLIASGDRLITDLILPIFLTRFGRENTEDIEVQGL